MQEIKEQKIFEDYPDEEEELCDCCGRNLNSYDGGEPCPYCCSHTYAAGSEECDWCHSTEECRQIYTEKGIV